MPKERGRRRSASWVTSETHLETTTRTCARPPRREMTGAGAAAESEPSATARGREERRNRRVTPGGSGPRDRATPTSQSRTVVICPRPPARSSAREGRDVGLVACWIPAPAAVSGKGWGWWVTGRSHLRKVPGNLTGARTLCVSAPNTSVLNGAFPGPRTSRPALARGHRRPVSPCRRAGPWCPRSRGARPESGPSCEPDASPLEQTPSTSCRWQAPPPGQRQAGQSRALQLTTPRLQSEHPPR